MDYSLGFSRLFCLGPLSSRIRERAIAGSKTDGAGKSMSCFLNSERDEAGQTEAAEFE